MLSTTTTIPAPLRFPNPLGTFFGRGGRIGPDRYLLGWLDIGPWTLDITDGWFLFCFVLFLYECYEVGSLSLFLWEGWREGWREEGWRGRMGVGKGLGEGWMDGRWEEWGEWVRDGRGEGKGWGEGG